MADIVFDRQALRAHPPRMTFEEFLHWIPSGAQAEWVDGEVVIFTISARHARMKGLLTGFLATFVAMHNLGEVLPAPFLMRAQVGGPAREPDIQVVRREHLDRVKPLWVEGPADFVVELMLDESVATDQVVKLREYAEAGVPEYLLLDVREDRQGFALHRLNSDGDYRLVTADGDGRYHSEILPGLWFDPRWFTLNPLPDPVELILAVAAVEYCAWIASL